MYIWRIGLIPCKKSSMKQNVKHLGLFYWYFVCLIDYLIFWTGWWTLLQTKMTICLVFDLQPRHIFNNNQFHHWIGSISVILLCRSTNFQYLLIWWSLFWRQNEASVFSHHDFSTRKNYLWKQTFHSCFILEPHYNTLILGFRVKSVF